MAVSQTLEGLIVRDSKLRGVTQPIKLYLDEDTNAELLYVHHRIRRKRS
jgi:hypothetical protein